MRAEERCASMGSAVGATKVHEKVTLLLFSLACRRRRDERQHRGGEVSHLPPLLSTFESLIPRLVARLLTVARVWGVVESYSIRRPQYLCAMSDLWKKRPST